MIVLKECDCSPPRMPYRDESGWRCSGCSGLLPIPPDPRFALRDPEEEETLP